MTLKSVPNCEVREILIKPILCVTFALVYAVNFIVCVVLFSPTTRKTLFSSIYELNFSEYLKIFKIAQTNGLANMPIFLKFEINFDQFKLN